MLQRYLCLFIVFLTSSVVVLAQNGTIYGVVKDDQGNTVELVTVAVEGTSYGTITRPDGSYELEIPAGIRSVIVFSNVSFDPTKKTITLTAGERRLVEATIKRNANTLGEFIKKADRTRYEAGSVQIDAKKANQLPSTIGGIEGLIKTMVGSNNELTSNYNVRGM